MANEILSFPEFPNDTPLLENTSYVISSNHPIKSVNATIPKNVTLYFMGGVLTVGTAGIELKGNQTRIVAPIEQIFASSLNVGGTWCLDRAYPQWFGAVGYFEPITNTSVDSADAINKAIKMKQTGEVFIPRGYYKIGKTILVKHGINLIGECGGHLIKNETPVSYDPKKCGTLLHSTGSITNYYGGYFMMINILTPSSGTTQGNAEWEVGYPNPGTSVKNIFFTNSHSNAVNLKGILVAGNFELDCLYWHSFRQAVACGLRRDNTYSDQKKITNCTFDFPKGTDNENLYAFDLSGLGDALMFEHNGIHHAINKKGLKLDTCNGGAITSNIINADVLIRACKGITYNSNHMEAGAQIVLIDSNVNLSNNYLWKGDRPSLIIRGSARSQCPVVESSGNMFLFYDIPVGQTVDYNVKNISEYDIQLEGNFCSVSFLQTYRYWIVAGVIDKINPFGIHISRLSGDNAIKSFQQFNNYSYLLSSSSRIMCGSNTSTEGFEIINLSHTKCLSNVSLYVNTGAPLSSYSKWNLDTNTYYYKCTTIWDPERMIIGKSQVLLSGGIALTKDGPGLTLLAADGVLVGCQYMVRIFRNFTVADENGEPVTYYHYVDVPICGSATLYDNGISISGFKWISGNPSITGITTIESITYNNENVQCRGTAMPAAGLGTWRKGDIIFNTGTGTTSMWMYNGTQWVAR